MLRLIPDSTTPPDKFRFTHPEDGWIDVAMDRKSWFAAIKKHRVDNGYPLPDDWQAQAEDQLCRILPPGWCLQEDGRSPEQFVDTRISLDDVLRGTRVLLSFMFHGMPTVPQAQIESRAKTCASCYMNIAIPGCSPCVGLSNLIADVSGNISTPADPMLRACAICHCSNQAQTRIPIEILAKGVTGEQRALFNTVEHCWKRAELAAM